MLASSPARTRCGRFRAQQIASGVSPTAIERPFSFRLGHDEIRGRIDRIDDRGRAARSSRTTSRRTCATRSERTPRRANRSSCRSTRWRTRLRLAVTAEARPAPFRRIGRRRSCHRRRETPRQGTKQADRPRRTQSVSANSSRSPRRSHAATARSGRSAASSARVTSTPEPPRSPYEHSPLRTRGAGLGGGWLCADDCRSAERQLSRRCRGSAARRGRRADRCTGPVDCQLRAHTPDRISRRLDTGGPPCSAVRPRRDPARDPSGAGRAQPADGRSSSSPCPYWSRSHSRFGASKTAIWPTVLGLPRRPAGPWHGTGGDSRPRAVR